MKLPLNFYLILATGILISLVVLVSLDVSFLWVFPLTVFGQFFLLLMVYKVLTDDYSTEKTFDDFYEDFPISEREN